MITKQSCNTSFVLMGSPPFKLRGQKLPPYVQGLIAYRCVATP